MRLPTKVVAFVLIVLAGVAVAGAEVVADETVAPAGDCAVADLFAPEAISTPADFAATGPAVAAGCTPPVDCGAPEEYCYCILELHWPPIWCYRAQC